MGGREREREGEGREEGSRRVREERGASGRGGGASGSEGERGDDIRRSKSPLRLTQQILSSHLSVDSLPSVRPLAPSSH